MVLASSSQKGMLLDFERPTGIAREHQLPESCDDSPQASLTSFPRNPRDATVIRFTVSHCAAS